MPRACAGVVAVRLQGHDLVRQVGDRLLGLADVE
jgi:hypothetical protein